MDSNEAIQIVLYRSTKETYKSEEQVISELLLSEINRLNELLNGPHWIIERRLAEALESLSWRLDMLQAEGSVLVALRQFRDMKLEEAGAIKDEFAEGPEWQEKVDELMDILSYSGYSEHADKIRGLIPGKTNYISGHPKYNTQKKEDEIITVTEIIEYLSKLRVERIEKVTCCETKEQVDETMRNVDTE